MKKIKTIIICLVLFSSCVYTEERSGEHLIYVKSRQEHPNLKFKIIEGNASLTEWTDVQKLKIFSVRGGAKYFMGRKIKEISGDISKRIFIVEELDTIQSYSVNEIFDLDYQILEDSIKVYLVP